MVNRRFDCLAEGTITHLSGLDAMTTGHRKQGPRPLPLPGGPRQVDIRNMHLSFRGLDLKVPQSIKINVLQFDSCLYVLLMQGGLQRDYSEHGAAAKLGLQFRG